MPGWGRPGWPVGNAGAAYYNRRRHQEATVGGGAVRESCGSVLVLRVDGRSVGGGGVSQVMVWYGHSRDALARRVGLVMMVAVSWSCRSDRRAVEPDIQSSEVAGRIAGIRGAVVSGDESAVPLLVDRLEDQDPAVRFAAIIALDKLTGRRMGYWYGHSAEKRAAAVRRWRRYLLTDVGGDVGAPEEPHRRR